MSGTHPGLRLPWRMFWTGLIIRVLYITLAHTYRVRLFQDHFQFGWEMGRIARALATGYGYADPFMGHSGPTAWCPPLYPLLLAAIFKLFGVYTPLSAWFILTINSVFSAATAIAIYEIARRSFNPRVALWSGWIWALYPAAMQYAVHWIWDMAITTCLFACVILIALKARGIGEPNPNPAETPNNQTKLWALFGLLWGAIALLNPSLLAFLPACGLWMASGTWTTRNHRQKLLPTARRALLAALLCAACIAPWIWRNWLVFHAFIPMRPTLGVELYQSSLESNNGFPWGGSISIYHDTPDMHTYIQLGEVAFSKERGEQAKAIFRAHPGRFQRYTLKRIFFFWAGVPHAPEHDSFKDHFLEWVRQLNYSFLSIAGILGLTLALHRRIPGATLYALAFLFVPTAYYLITVQARFRAPLEPLICILGVYLFQSATPRPATISPPPRLDRNTPAGI